MSKATSRSSRGAHAQTDVIVPEQPPTMLQGRDTRLLDVQLHHPKRCTDAPGHRRRHFILTIAPKPLHCPSNGLPGDLQRGPGTTQFTLPR
jgi:hypothetical protein